MTFFQQFELKTLALFVATTFISYFSLADDNRFTAAAMNFSSGQFLHHSVKTYNQSVSKKMGVEFQLLTYASACELLDATLSEPQDIIVTTPMWVPFLVNQHGFKPILKTVYPSTYFALSRSDAKVESIEQLKGKRVSKLDSAFTWGIVINESIDSYPGLRASMTFSNYEYESAVLELVAGNLDVVFVSPALMSRIPQKLKLHSFSFTADMPASVLLAKPDANPELVARYRKAVKSVPSPLGYKVSYEDAGSEVIEKIRAVVGEPSPDLCQ